MNKKMKYKYVEKSLMVSFKTLYTLKRYKKAHKLKSMEQVIKHLLKLAKEQDNETTISNMGQS